MKRKNVILGIVFIISGYALFRLLSKQLKKGFDTEPIKLKKPEIPLTMEEKNKAMAFYSEMKALNEGRMYLDLDSEKLQQHLDPYLQKDWNFAQNQINSNLSQIPDFTTLGQAIESSGILNMTPEQIRENIAKYQTGTPLPTSY